MENPAHLRPFGITRRGSPRTLEKVLKAGAPETHKTVSHFETGTFESPAPSTTGGARSG